MNPNLVLSLGAVAVSCISAAFCIGLCIGYQNGRDAEKADVDG